MTDQAAWWRAAPPAEAEIACGDGRHVIRWADGVLALPAHPDAEAELILGALGGQKAACVELAETWARHRDDLTVLALGPRSPADKTNVGWNDVELARSGIPAGGRAAQARLRAMRRSTPAHPVQAVTSGLSAARIASGTHGVGRGAWVLHSGPARWAADPHLIDLLTLLALGTSLQIRLAGAVAAAWCAEDAGDRAGDRAASRPALTAALAGRFAPAAAAWLGIDPDEATVSLHEGPGWGRLERAGTGLRASLPLAWLARVWACDLAVVAGHLVVAVQEARWPDARVLAVPEPGAEPVSVTARADTVCSGAGTGGSGDHAHWTVTGRSEETGADET